MEAVHFSETKPDIAGIQDEVVFCEWDRQGPFWHHAAAGSCAGVVEHVSIYPLDNIKTNLQAFPGSQTAPRFRDVWRQLSQRGIVHGFFRGSATVIMGCVPAHIALFATYERSKYYLITANQSSAEMVPRAAICGGAATVVHDLIVTPTDVIKQRLQLGCYSTIRDAVRNLLAEEGPSCFFRSMPVTMAMNVPYGCIQVAANEWGKRQLNLSELHDSESVRRNLPWFFLSAGFSGALAAFCTQPLDVMKTRLQTQDCLLTCQTTCLSPDLRPINTEGRNPIRPNSVRRQAKYSGIADAFRKILAQEGAAIFFKGSFARAAICIPSAAISWGTYEAVKSSLQSL